MSVRVITRADAALLGLTRYFTGKPCKRGHVSERRAGYGTCIACESMRGGSEKMRAYKAEYRSKNSAKCSASYRKWREANPEKVRSDHAKYYFENRKRCVAQSMAWASANRDRSRSFISRWKACNPDKLAASERNRRARIATAEGNHSTADIARIRTLQKDKCSMCRTKLRGKGHVDHIIALVNGGSNWPRNLQILCKPCNLSKNAKHPIVFAQQRGLLI